MLLSYQLKLVAQLDVGSFFPQPLAHQPVLFSLEAKMLLQTNQPLSPNLGEDLPIWMQEGLAGAREIIQAELTKRVNQIFSGAEAKVKPMQANGLNSDASKSDREKLNRMLEEIVAVIVIFRIGHIALSYQV